MRPHNTINVQPKASSAGRFNISYLTVSIVSMFGALLPTQAYANCSFGANYLHANDGASCVIDQTTVPSASMRDGYLTYVTYSAQKAAVLSTAGSSITANQDISIEQAGGTRHAIQIFGKLKVNGNLKAASADSKNSRALHIESTGDVDVTGNLMLTRTGSGGSAVLQNDKGVLNVGQDVRLEGSNVDGFRSYGTTTIGGDLGIAIDAQNAAFVGMNNRGNTYVKGKVDIKASQEGTVGMLMESGEASTSTLHIDTKNTAIKVGTGSGNKGLLLVGSDLNSTAIKPDAFNIILQDKDTRILSENANAIEIVGPTTSYTLIDQATLKGRHLFMDAEGDATLEIIEGSDISGNINMGKGNDVLIVNGNVDMSKVALADGGFKDSADDVSVNRLVFKKTRREFAPSQFINWDDLELNDSELTVLAQDTNVLNLSDAAGRGVHVNNNSTLIFNDNYAVTGNLAIDGGSVLDLSRDKGFKEVSFTGDYTGQNGAVIKMNTVWNGPGSDVESASDVLLISGKVLGDGQTVVQPIGANGAINIIEGNVTQIKEAINTIDVIKTGGAYEGAFVGTAQTSGAAEAQLVRDGNNFRWTIEALKEVGPDKPDPETEKPGSKPTIYTPGTSAYVQMPSANMELGYATLGSLHERRGENQALAWDDCGTCGPNAKSQTWARLFGKHLDLKGKDRWNTKGDMYAFQFGHDFDIRYDDANGSRRQSGVMLTYAQAKNDFFDEGRAENGRLVSDKYTGKGKTDQGSLALYSTYYAQTGAYLDLVGQVGYLRNKYEARNGINVNQNGWNALASAEVGRPYLMGASQWQIEPQAQLIYQYLKLDGFNDGVKEVKQKDNHGVRGRIGARLAYNQSSQAYKTQTVYGIANIWHDFTSPKSVSINGDDLKEKYNKTWGEVGLGVQLPVGKGAYVYADARYEHSFGGDKREGYRGALGFKRTWQ